MGQVEMGQGMYTAMPQLLAEELEVGLDQVRLEHAPPDEKRYANPLFHFQATGGSTSVMGLYEPMRRAGATARTMLIAAAAERWQVDPATCHGERSAVIHAPSRRRPRYRPAARAIRWDDGPNATIGTEDVVRELAAAAETPGVVARKEGDAAAALAGAAAKLEAVYEAPFLAHVAMEPINCTVHVRPDRCEVWTGSQVLGRAQATAAQVTGLPLDKVVVHNHLLGGGFGRRLEHDYVTQAVRIAKQVEGPVKIIWTREEDVQHDVFRPYNR